MWGTQNGDFVGGGTSGYASVYEVTDGSYVNYVVLSPTWANGPTLTFANCGAATWGDGTAPGPLGPVNELNSLVGTQPGDFVGSAAFPLTKGNYVVTSGLWQNVTTGGMHAGAATWCNGTAASPVGAVNETNSLVGTHTGDGVAGFVYQLPNGNYVVVSDGWAYFDTMVLPNVFNLAAGAVTWGDGSIGVMGQVSASNSLIGTAA